jgi:iron(III) transport system permease protein
VEYLLDVQHRGHCRLTHVPHAYLYISPRCAASVGCGRGRAHGGRIAAAGDDLGEPADGATVDLYACVLLFFLGLEVFGLMLVLGDPEGNMVLATYLYKLTNKLGTPPIT